MALIDDVLGRKIVTRGRIDARSIASQLGSAYDRQLIDQYNRLQRNLRRAGVITPAQIRAAELLDMPRGSHIKSIRTARVREIVISFITADTATAVGARRVARDQADNIRAQIKYTADYMANNGLISNDDHMMLYDLMDNASDYQIRRLMDAYPDLYGRYKQDSNDYFLAISARFIAGMRQNQQMSIANLLKTMTSSKYVAAESDAIASAAYKTNIHKNINAADAVAAIATERGF